MACNILEQVIIYDCAVRRPHTTEVYFTDTRAQQFLFVVVVCVCVGGGVIVCLL